ncbi:MAG: SIMPL domain-containing protein [Gemmatimonadota bacterium]
MTLQIGSRVRAVGGAALLLVSPVLLPAQVTAPPSQIVTSGTGEATLVPDRGYINFAVETRAKTAAQAGADNARTQAAVIAALRAKGVAAEHITTSGYSVGPDEQYPNGERKLLGYIARNAVIVDVQKLDRVGSLIDTALAAGANSIGGLRYYSTQMESIRRTALERAVSHARGDAEVLARAAGGALGAALEISVVNSGGPRPMFSVMTMERSRSADVETPVAVGEQTISVSVSTRWAFVSPK